MDLEALAYNAISVVLAGMIVLFVYCHLEEM